MTMGMIIILMKKNWIRLMNRMTITHCFINSILIFLVCQKRKGQVLEKNFLAIIS